MNPAVLASLFPSGNKQYTQEEVKDILTSKAIEAICEIVKANEENMASYKSNPKVLDAGIYYPNDYYKALRSLNQQRRIDFLIQKGSFWHGYAPSSHFEMIPAAKGPNSPTGVIGCVFVVIKGVLPTEALASLRQKTYFIGCAEVCQIAFYEAVKHLLGNEKFNRLFSADSSTPLMLGQSPKNPISALMRGLPSGAKLEKGQMVQFKNTPLYPLKHITGGGRNYFTICLDATPGKETFTALGLSHKGLSYEGMRSALTAIFNDDPLGTQTLTAEVAKLIISPELLAKSKELATAKIDESEAKKFGIGEIGTMIEIGYDRIALLANTDFNIARLLLDDWAIAKISTIYSSK